MQGGATGSTKVAGCTESQARWAVCTARQDDAEQQAVVNDLLRLFRFMRACHEFKRQSKGIDRVHTVGVMAVGKNKRLTKGGKKGYSAA
eukprot:1739642-Amphidinium_carterae.1